MGKRSNFARNPRDFYITPPEAVRPLLPFLDPGTLFVEPCAGNGALVDHLEHAGHRCVWASDIEPQRHDVRKLDAMDCLIGGATHFITNPPWKREILHPLIVHLSDQAPTWLLFDADWMHTVQAAPCMERCLRIVSAGRFKWIPGSKFTGVDNACWYLFDRPEPGAALFHGRLPKPQKIQQSTELEAA